VEIDPFRAIGPKIFVANKGNQNVMSKQKADRCSSVIACVTFDPVFTGNYFCSTKSGVKGGLGIKLCKGCARDCRVISVARAYAWGMS
jgi:hypothetical protein